MASFASPWRSHLLAAVWLALLVAPAVAEQLTEPAAEVTRGEPAELTVWNRPIVTLRGRIGETSPAQRAERAAERIASIPDAELGEPARVVPAKVGHLEGMMAFVGSRQVFSILREDLDPETNETLAEVGAAAEQHLREVLAARAAQRSLPLLLRGIGLSAGAILLFAVVVWTLRRVERWLEPR